MAIATQRIRDEHRVLMPHIEMLRKVADSVGAAPLPEVRRGLHEAHDFLSNHLAPHAHAEDRVLYPVVAKIMGAPQATATMSRDHSEVGRLTRELKVLLDQVAGRPAMTDNQNKGLRRVLYGLYTLVSNHFAKEEEIYLPLLDAHMTETDAEKMFRAMETVAKEVHAHE